MRIPRWATPRRAVLFTAACAVLSAAIIVDRVRGTPWQVWGDIGAVVLAVALVAGSWAASAREERLRRMERKGRR